MLTVTYASVCLISLIVLLVISCIKSPVSYVVNFIGQSNRAFKHRFTEHSRSLNNRNSASSALTDHVLQKHPHMILSINDFDLMVIERCKDPLETRLAEARHMKRLTPQINRRCELTDF